jgi:hypothetical protein
MGDMIDRAAVQSEVRAYLVHESTEIALRVEQLIAALPPADDAVEALVKAEWSGLDCGYLDTGIPCGYAIVGADDEGWQVSLSWRTCEETLDGTHATMDAARSAAEADLRGRLAAIRAGGKP